MAPFFPFLRLSVGIARRCSESRRIDRPPICYSLCSSFRLLLVYRKVVFIRSLAFFAVKFECSVHFLDMSDDDHQFESKADAGASKTFPQQAGAIRKNSYIVIKSRPCKVVDVSTSKTGKHGHAKCH
eukprot:c13799_g1_i1 orf=1-378(-)